jgi:hypothetical protein
LDESKFRSWPPAVSVLLPRDGMRGSRVTASCSTVTAKALEYHRRGELDNQFSMVNPGMRIMLSVFAVTKTAPGWMALAATAASKSSIRCRFFIEYCLDGAKSLTDFVQSLDPLEFRSHELESVL